MNNKSQSLMNLRLPSGIEKIDRVMEGYQTYQILRTALDIGVFELLDEKGPGDRNDIAQWAGINGMFSRSFLDTLVDIGFLSKDGEKYANTKTTVDFLLNRNPFYQGDWVKNLALNSQWNDLSSSLSRRQPEPDNFDNGPSGAFLDGLGQRALRGELQSVAEAVANWNGFHAANKLLDIGGGHGLYAIALCQANPHLTGIVFDKPHVMTTTIRYIEDYQMQERLFAVSGDICSDPLGTEYDIIIMSHLLYKFRKNLEPIFDKVCACLNPGGLLVTNHWFCAPGCSAENAGVQELAKALQSFGHPLCHVEDFERMFASKGLEMVATKIVPTSFGPSRLNLAVQGPKPSNCSSSRTCCCC